MKGSVLALGVLLVAAVSATAATLARDGQATCTIVVGREAIEPERTAADELAAYLERITGSRPAVESERREGTNVFVGRSTVVDELLPGIEWDALGTDGIVIKTIGDDLILAGGRPRGTLYAVYTFLQDVVGCRWYAGTNRPTDPAETIPDKPSLDVADLNVVYRPPFDFRQYYTEAARDPLFAVKLRLNGREHLPEIPQAFGGAAYIGHGHTLLREFLKPEDHFDERPDWYAYNRTTGKREPRAICFTNEAACEQATREVLAFLGEHPDTRIVSVGCEDSNAVCECDDCTALREKEGGESGPLLQFVNAVAARVEKQYPDVLVSTLAFWHTDRPPNHVRPRKNVLVQLAVLDRNHKHAIPDVPHFSRYLRRWSQIAEHVYMWDYDPHFRNFLQPHPNHFVAAKSLRFYRDQGVTGVFTQGSWGPAGEFMRMRAWVTAQLMWNPDQDERALMVEFLNGYYGADGPYLMKYIDLIHDAIHRQPDLWLGVYDATTRHWLTLEDLNAATRLFDQATAAVAQDDTLSYRVRRARLSIDIVWVERYRELRRTARQQGRTFLGPADPYAEVEHIAQNEFGIDCYREWAEFPEYVAKLRRLFPPRPEPVPVECEKLPHYEWEDIQEDRLTLTPQEAGQIVEDPGASNGQALRLEGADKSLEAKFTLPAHLEGRWRIHAVVRAQPAGDQPSAIVLGIYAWNMPSGNANEVYRVVAECPEEHTNEYRTFDLGVHRLKEGATIQVQPSGAGSYGEIRTTWIDRLFLIAAE